MTEPVLERLAPALDELLAAERPLAGPSPAQANSIFNRITNRVAAPTPAPRWPWVSLGSAFIVAVSLTRALTPAPLPTLEPLLSAPAPHFENVELVAPARHAPLRKMVVEVTPNVIAASAAADGTGEEALARERALLEDARTALQQNNGEAALRALERHAHDFSDGQLAEERDALSLRALRTLRRFSEADAGAEAFVRHYPNSVLRQSVERHIGDK